MLAVLLSDIGLGLIFLAGVIYSLAKQHLAAGYVAVALIVIPILAVLVAVVFLLAFRRELGASAVHRIARLLHRFIHRIDPDALARSAEEIADEAREALTGKRFLIAMGLALANWLLDIFVLYLFFLALGHHQHFGALLVAYALANMAAAIVRNAKLRRVGVCGATETLLIDRDAAPALLPVIASELADCELRGDALARSIVAMGEASEADWHAEYLAPVLAIRTVEGIEEAIAHIRCFGTSHTEAIIAEDRKAAEHFLAEVDSAIVMWNASTQFADGGEFGFGAEIGIATGKLHARGPVGPEQLTTFNYRVRGRGQTRP